MKEAVEMFLKVARWMRFPDWFFSEAAKCASFDKVVMAAGYADPEKIDTVLLYLVSAGSKRVRETLTESIFAGPYILLMLACDASTYVRFLAFQHINMPRFILALRAQDENEDFMVLQRIASHKITPPEALLRLAAHPDHRVRWRVAQNQFAPIEILTKLFYDKDEGVQRAARQTLGFDA